MPTSLRKSSFAYRVNSEDLSSDRTLTNDDFEIQDYTSTIPTTLNIILPASPVIHRFFAFINDISSQGNLLIDGIILHPGDRYEIIFNGAIWKIL